MLETQIIHHIYEERECILKARKATLRFNRFVILNLKGPKIPYLC
jgi:hypothetical protein